MSSDAAGSEVPRVLMVCLGNICRSPTAEAALREAALEAGMDVVVDSAGTAGWHEGDPPDRRSVEAARDLGLVVEGAGRQVRVSDFDQFDLILAMDEQNATDLRDLAPTPEAAEKVRLFRSFQAGAPALASVPDPYYGGPDGFVEVVNICRESAAGLVRALADGTA